MNEYYAPELLFSLTRFAYPDTHHYIDGSCAVIVGELLHFFLTEAVTPN